jgi:hypothetical protein
VRFAYIDETYTAEQFWIVSLVVPDVAAKNLETAMSNIVAATKNNIVAATNKSFPEIDASAELHGYTLDAGSKDWAPLHGKPQGRVDVYKAAIKALCDQEGVYLFRSCVNLAKLSWGEHHDPHDWALKFLFEKIDREFLNKDLVLAICDDVRRLFRKWSAAEGGSSQLMRSCR